MKKNLLLASFILLGTLLSPSAFAARKKLPPMNEYVGQLMSRMTLQEKIGQLNLMVAGDITTGSTMDTQVAGDIAAGKMGGVFNIKGFDKIKALQNVAIRKSRLGIRSSWAWTSYTATKPSSPYRSPSPARGTRKL